MKAVPKLKELVDSTTTAVITKMLTYNLIIRLRSSTFNKRSRI